jgi:CheY-like chemotaxis protein
MKKLNLLLIEDNPTDDFLIREVLTESEMFFYEINSLVDGLEALSFLHQGTPVETGQNPEIILLDLDLPRMSGFDFLDEIRKDEYLRTIPVFIITTSATKEDRKKAEMLNVRYLIKPFDLKEFENALLEVGV